jgi:hypothetical protein
MDKYDKALYQTLEALLRAFELVKLHGHPVRTGKGNIALIVLLDPAFKAKRAVHLPVSFP